MSTATNSTGYGPRGGLLFSGDESKLYELWEVKFLAYMRMRKLYNVFVPAETDQPTAAERVDAFAELVQCLDDRSLSLVIREAKDDGQLSRKRQATSYIFIHRIDGAQEDR